MTLSLFIYSSIFILTSLLSEFSVRLRNKTLLEKVFKVFLVIFTISLPAFFAGIRYGIGTDYYNYVRIFNSVISGTGSRVEIGYQALNLLVGSLGGSEHVLFFIVNFLTIYFIYIFLDNYKHYISVGLGMFIFLLLYYNTSFNIVRQVLAIAIVLNSFVFIDKKEASKFYMLVIFATLIHRSSIVIFPFYYLYNNLVAKSRFTKILIYSVVFFALFNYQYIVEIISINILGDSYYLHYASSEDINLGFGLFIAYGPVIVIGSLYYNRLSYVNEKFKLYYFLLIIGFILRLLPYFGASYLERIADYFLVTQVWLIPFYYKILNKRSYKFVISQLLILFYVVYWFYIVIVQGGAGTVPYTTFINI